MEAAMTEPGQDLSTTDLEIKEILVSGDWPSCARLELGKVAPEKTPAHRK